MKFRDNFIQLLYDSNQLKEEYITENFIKDFDVYDVLNIVELFPCNERICLLCVKQYGWLLKYVKNQTEEICLEAVKKSGLALEFVKNQTENICLEAVKKNSSILMFVNPKFKEICEKYLKENRK